MIHGIIDKLNFKLRMSTNQIKKFWFVKMCSRIQFQIEQFEEGNYVFFSCPNLTEGGASWNRLHLKGMSVLNE